MEKHDKIKKKDYGVWNDMKKVLLEYREEKN